MLCLNRHPSHPRHQSTAVPLTRLPSSSSASSTTTHASRPPRQIQTPKTPIPTMHTASSRTPTISCLLVSLNRTTTLNYIGSRSVSRLFSRSLLIPARHTQDGETRCTTRCTTGSVVSSLYHLKSTENRIEDAGFFVFPDLSVCIEGTYRLKLSLFEVVWYVPLLSNALPFLIHPKQHCSSLQVHLFGLVLRLYSKQKFWHRRSVASLG